MSVQSPSRSGRNRAAKKPSLKRFVEHKLMNEVSYEEYRDAVREKYDGPQGALLKTASFLSGHLAMGERMFRKRRFDLAGSKSILDIGSGAGQIARLLVKYSDADARITCMDLSLEMLRRSRKKLQSDKPRHVATDLLRLPFADGSFDTITCGYVLEYLPDPRPGLAELARVLVPGGRMLLFATEDSVSGAFTSRIWLCRTFNRRDLRTVCHQAGLNWSRELWFSRMHRLLKAGGICVEMVRTG